LTTRLALALGAFLIFIGGQPRAFAEQVVLTPPAAPDEPKHATAPLATSDSETKERGILGPVLIGPMVSTLSIPTLFRVALEAKVYKWFDFAIEYGMLPRVVIDTALVSATSVSAKARIFPFQKSLFVGVGFGVQSLKAEKTEVADDIEIHGTATVVTSYITPEIGWRWVWPSGLTMGLEFGCQLAQSSTSMITTDAPASLVSDPTYDQVTNDLSDAGNQIGNTSLPDFAFAQIGYLF
jgi:hypothetical protein